MVWVEIMYISVLNPMLEICAICMLIIMFWALLTEKKDTEHVEGYLIFLFEAVIIMLFVDVISYFIQYVSTDKSNLKVFNFLTYSLCALSIYIYSCYCYTFINNTKKTSKMVVYLVSALCFLGVLGRFILGFSDWIIYTNDSGVIGRGKYYYIFVIILAVATFIPCIYMSIYYKILGKTFSVVFYQG